METGLRQFFSFSAKIQAENAKTIKTALHQCLSIRLLKTPDLCNLRSFVTIFFVAIYALFPPIFGGKKQTPAFYPLLECMRVTLQDNKETKKIELHGQWKLEAEFRKMTKSFVYYNTETNRGHRRTF